MVHGTAVVWLPITDVQRSMSFYRDKLGLEEVHRGEDWAELDANGLHIGLNATEEPKGGGGAVVAFQPQGGLDATVEQLRADEVEIAGEISEHPGVVSPHSKTPTATTCSSTSLPPSSSPPRQGSLRQVRPAGRRGSPAREPIPVRPPVLRAGHRGSPVRFSGT